MRPERIQPRVPHAAGEDVGLELLPREFPYRACPICRRPVNWVYSARDLEPGVYGLGAPRCPRHGRLKGWVVEEGEALQQEFLTGGFVTRESGWVEVE